MSINLGTFLALLLLLSIVGSIPSIAGQNASDNVTASNVNDLVDSATSASNVNDLVDSATSASNVNDLVDSATSASNVNDLVDSATSASNVNDLVDSATDREEDPSSSLFVNDADTSSIVTASGTIVINEVELNPGSTNGEGKEWIELYNPTEVDINISDFEIRTYNPTEVDINISDFEIRTSSKSATIELPSDAVIKARDTYVIELDSDTLSNTGERLTLADATGNIIDRTPSLVDRSDDERTWQRIPDGNNEWQFLENTRGSLNDPNSSSTAYTSVYPRSEDVECVGSAGCIAGIAIRVVDAGTIYVNTGSTGYKIDLALIEAPSSTDDDRFSESTAFTRDLCLGSSVLVDQDDKLLISDDSSIIAVVYCSSSNLNSELLDNGYADLDIEQCATSEFANEPWAKDHGC